MKLYYFVITILFVTIFDVVITDQNYTSSDNPGIFRRLLSRKKRYLVFPTGSIMQLAYCLNLRTLIPDSVWTYGITFGTNWELPTDPSIRRFGVRDPEPDMVHRRHRRDLYRKLVPILEIMGLDGQSCLLRALCEAGQRPLGAKGSFVQEILHAIFTLPPRRTAQSTEDDEELQKYDTARNFKRDCADMFPSCISSLMEMTEP